MKKNILCVLIAVVIATTFIGIMLATNNPEAPRTWLHPKMTYAVTEARDGKVTCVSEPFNAWPYKQIRATAILNSENLPKLQPGTRFTVTRLVGNYTKSANNFISVVN